MEKELDIDIIKITQTSLGKYVKRPQLTEKLLRKPPFRFLHDIVTTVLKQTGFFEGLYEEDELVSENVKERDSKIIFLNKAITVLEETTGKSLLIKPSKVVAGQEAEKTNQLLQCLAYALDNKLSSSEAVKKYKQSTSNKTDDGDRKTKSEVQNVKKSDAKSDKKLTSRSSEKLTSQKSKREDHSVTRNDKEKTNKPNKVKVEGNVSNQTKSNEVKKGNTNKKQIPTQKVVGKSKNSENNKVSQKQDLIKNVPDKLKLNGLEQNEGNEKKLQVTETVEDVVEKENILDRSIREDDDVLSTPPINAAVIVNNAADSKPTSGSTKGLSNKNIDSNETPKLESNVHTQVLQYESSEEKNEDKFNDGSEITNINKEKSITISAIKSTKDINRSSMRPTSVRPSSSRPGAPRLKEKHEETYTPTENLLVGRVNIIAENMPNDEEEETSLIVVDDQARTEISNIAADSNQHGHLVQQILDSQKEFSQIASGKTEIEWEFDTQKSKEASSQEIAQTRFNIEALSRISNPLGKLLDHIQEDVEVMRQELQQWTEQYEQSSKELAKQKTANEESLLPMLSKIKQLDMDIDDKRDKINDLKVIIHKNSSRINILLTNGDVQ